MTATLESGSAAIAALPPTLFVRLRIALLCLVALVVCGLAADAVLEIVRTREEAVAEATRQTSNLAETLELHASSAFRIADLAAVSLADRMSHRAGRPGLTPEEALELIRERLDPSLPYRNLVVTDASGNIRVDGTGIAPTFNIADRSYFRVHRDRPDAGMFISEPIRSRLGRGWFVAVSRRITDAAGAFAGIAYAVIDLDMFDRFYASLDVGENGVVTLWSREGYTLARRPRDAALADNPARFAELVIPYREPGYRGTRRSVSPIDGKMRVRSMRAATDLPVLVTVGLAEEDFLALWRTNMWQRMGASAAAFLFVAALTLLLFRQLRVLEATTRALRESEAQARASSGRLTAMVNALPDLAFILDGDGRYAEVIGHGSPDLLAVPAESLHGRSLHDVLPEPVADRLLAATRETIAGGGPQRLEYPLTTQAGRPAWFEGRTAVLPADFAPSPMALFLARDITDRVEAAERLARARDLAESASRTKSAFLATMSHELRTPLNAIIGFSEIMVHGMFGPLGNDRYREYATHIHQSGIHLLDLINNILDMSKLEAGRFALEERPVALGEVIAACAALNEVPAGKGGVSVSVEMAGDPPWVMADERALRQILLNLLSNAVKFTPAGGTVTVTVESPSGGPVALRIADTGIGISPEAMEHITEPFHQADTSISRRFGGTGLGLAITRSLVELHGGTLDIDSREGSGTTVTVSLPRERVVEPSL